MAPYNRRWRHLPFASPRHAGSNYVEDGDRWKAGASHGRYAARGRRESTASDTLGSAQVQTPEATTEACANVAGRCGETNARALPPLAAFICERPDAGSRMSREAHVRFCERAVAKFRRA